MKAPCGYSAHLQIEFMKEELDDLYAEKEDLINSDLPNGDREIEMLNEEISMMESNIEMAENGLKTMGKENGCKY